jgi:hypothetical protein
MPRAHSIDDILPNRIIEPNNIPFSERHPGENDIVENNDEQAQVGKKCSDQKIAVFLKQWAGSKTQ